jgi:DNA invertase Pin-like site-specific DNA recombinase
VLVIWELDRPGRTAKRLVDLVADMREQGGRFRSLTDDIDTTTPAGRFSAGQGVVESAVPFWAEDALSPG